MPKADLDSAWRDGDDVYGPGENVEMPERVYELLKERGAFSEEQHQEELSGYDALPEEVREILASAGYSAEAQIELASDDELLAIDGIGPKRLEQIREAVSS